MQSASEKKLAQQVNEYQQVAKETPGVDIGMLMLNALQNQKKNLVSSRVKRWAYLISLGVPPFGILFAAKYFFSDEDDAKTVAWTCVILTAVALVFLYILTKMLFSGTGATPEQLQQIKPSDIMQLTQ